MFELFKEHLPQFRESYLTGTGPVVGARESRRIRGLETLRMTDIEARSERTDISTFEPYITLGVVKPLLGKRLVVGFYALLPAAQVQQTDAFFSDEREQYFSNNLHFELGTDRLRLTAFALALASELTPLPGAPDYILGVMVHRRHVIGVLDLASWLERPHTGMPDGTERLVIIEHGDMTAGICTDAFTQIVDIPHHKLEQARSKHHRAIHHNPYISAILPIREHAVPLLHITKLLSDAALNH